MTNASFTLNLDGNVFAAIKQLQEQFGRLETSVKGIESNTKDSFSKIGSSLSQIKFASITQNLQNLNQGFQELNGPGMDFNSSMADLQAITGLTGKSLDEIGEKARNNAKVFGGNAAKSLESYKLLLSQLTPELAKQPIVLDKMATNVALLSKTMGGNTTAATEVLTTAMNQYGVSMENPMKAAKEMTNMMNIMSASAKEGSAELPTIKQAIENVGGQAKLSGLDFAEMNSAIQFLDKAGKKGAEGGTALRSILTNLGKGRFLPEKTAEELRKAGVDVKALADKNVSFTDKMRMLQPVLAKDSELINTLFGEYGQAASALIESADGQDKMTKAVQGTNTTQEQAAVVMETTAEKMARMRAKVDDVKLGFFQATGGVTAYLEPFAQLSTTFASFAPILSGAKSGFMKLKDVMKSASTETNNVQAATSRSASVMKGLGTAIKGIGIAAFVAVVAEGAMAFYNMASGADAAERAIGHLNKAKEAGSKAGQKINNTGDKAFDKAMRELEQLKTAKEIDDKQFIKRKKEIAQNQYEYYYSEVSNLKALIKIKEDDAKRKKSQGDDAGYRAAEISRKQSISELTAISENAAESLYKLNDVKSEIKGNDKVEGSNGSGVKSKPLVSPSGYSDKPTSGSGGEMKNITVTIQNLVKELTISTTNVTESMGMMKEKVTEALVAAVRDFEVAM